MHPNLKWRGLASATVLASALLAFGAGPANAAPAPPAKEAIAPPGAFTNSRERVKAFATLPDWSGAWSLTGTLIYDPKTAYNPPDPAGDVGGFSYGPLVGAYEKPPYKPEYQAKYDAILKRQIAEFSIHDSVADCQPQGAPRAIFGAPGPTEFTVNPGEVWITWNRMNQTRRIYTDGRGHPKGDDSWPMVMGHSIGHWEGDTLVVDTTNMFAGALDHTEAFHSDQVHLIERIRRISPTLIEDQMIFEDPLMFTHPWEITRTYKKQPEGTELEGVYCDNNRNPSGADGSTITLLGSDLAAHKP
jgi:hypothetical protein